MGRGDRQQALLDVRLDTIDLALENVQGEVWEEPYLDQKVQLHTEKGDLWAERGRIGDAIQEYSQAIRHASFGLQLKLNERGLVHYFLNNDQQAYDDHTTALEVTNYRGDKELLCALLYNRGVTQHGLGRAAEAIQDITLAIRLIPDFRNPYLDRADAYEQLGDKEKALADRQLAETLPERERSPFHNFSPDRLRYELPFLNLGVKHNSERLAKAYEKRFGCWYERNKNEEALADIHQAARLCPDNDSYQIWEGALNRELGRPTEALACVERAIALNPESGLYFHNRAYVQEELGDRQGALADYTRSIELLGHPFSYQHRATILEELGNTAGAIVDYRQAVLLLESGSPEQFEVGVAEAARTLHRAKDALERLERKER